MPRPKTDTTKHTLHFFTGDIERLKELYPVVGASVIVRTLVRKHIEGIEAKLEAADSKATEIEI